MIKKNKIIGIDLGTTNSVMAVVEGGQPRIVLNANGERTTPSMVAFTSNDILIGEEAKRQLGINFENTYFSAKRFIGAKLKRLPLEIDRLPYSMKFDEKSGMVTFPCPMLGTEMSPQEISAQVIRRLVTDAEADLGESINQVVIAVPAYFNDKQRKATIDAGKIAEIDVFRIINEPTAASLAYGLDKNKHELILVFDLGGGTFDVSVLDVGEGLFEVLSTAGNHNLGGDNFDEALADWLLSEFVYVDKTVERLSYTSQPMQRLLDACEKSKRELAFNKFSEISLPFLVGSANGPKHIEFKLNRSFYEFLTRDLVKSCRLPVEQALSDAGIEERDINQVVFVGGSTRMPAVKRLLKQITNKKINLSINPDEVVAIGAAVQGAILTGQIDEVLLLDVTPLSLGVETLGGLMGIVIERNTTIPVRKSDIFTTAVDNQHTVEIHVLQGEREIVSGNKSLGNFKLVGIPEAKRGTPEIQVTFDLNIDGILSVSATETKTGIEQSIIIEDMPILTDDQITEILMDAENSATYDLQEGEIIRAKNNAMLYKLYIDELVDNLGSKLTTPEIESLYESLNSLDNLILGREINVIKNAMQNIQNKITELEQRL